LLEREILKKQTSPEIAVEPHTLSERDPTVDISILLPVRSRPEPMKKCLHSLIDLAKKPVISGKTLANTYIDQINNVGNLAQQATITQQALTVVNDQAVAARDKVSGVNLDEEAASLIRYQQAYQASAKALQISGTLFDAIVQIR